MYYYLSQGPQVSNLSVLLILKKHVRVLCSLFITQIIHFHINIHVLKLALCSVDFKCPAVNR